MQLAFSPSQNLLAWTDSEGILTWWKDPVPADSPDPVKQNMPTDISAKVKAASTSRNNDSDNNAIGKDPHAEGNDNGNVYDDDWIIDDLGDGMADDSAEDARKRGDEFVKEMGMSHCHNRYGIRTNLLG